MSLLTYSQSNPQLFLLCGCGKQVYRKGLCPTCYRAHRLSLERFNGLRESVLLRDGRRCQTCGTFEKILVHHRRNKARKLRDLITECRTCHPRIHNTLRPRYGFPEALRILWREQHRGLAEQLELEFAAKECRFVQVGLFAAA